MTHPQGRQELSRSRCLDCTHDGYAHGLPSAHILDTACDACECARFRPDPNELRTLLGVPTPPEYQGTPWPPGNGDPGSTGATQ